MAGNVTPWDALHGTVHRSGDRGVRWLEVELVTRAVRMAHRVVTTLEADRSRAAAARRPIAIRTTRATSMFSWIPATPTTVTR